MAATIEAMANTGSAARGRPPRRRRAGSERAGDGGGADTRGGGADAAEARLILEVLRSLVEPLHRSIPGSNEVVLHDLAKLPDSIVAIAGNVTGREVGSPATDTLLRAAASGDLVTTVAYESRLPGGRELRSTTMICRDGAGIPVAALCINVDVTMWRAIHVLATSMLPDRPLAPTAGAEDHAAGEDFVNDIDELAQHLLTQAIAAVRVPVDLMQKRHKLAVVQDLKERGFFMLKESVETAAQALGVTRFTIYNYLNELEPGSGAE